MHQRQCLSFISIAGFSTPDAAFDTTMSRRANDASNAAKSSSTLSGSPTLHWIVAACRPIARTSPASASASSWLL